MMTTKRITGRRRDNFAADLVAARAAAPAGDRTIEVGVLTLF